MATNKNAIIRYQALDQCFRNPGKRYHIQNLVEASNNSLLDIDAYSTGIRKRQTYDDIKFMRDSKGYDAPIETIKDGRRVYYRYSDMNFSINNQPINEKEAIQLKETLTLLSRFKGLPQFKWIEEIKLRLEQSFKLTSQPKVISFDENQYLSGLEYISILFNSVVNEEVLSIRYKPFKNEKELTFILHPYHIKQYNNRWFLFGLNQENSLITNIALDRIIEINETNITHIKNTNIDFNEYFDDVIGVSIPYDTEESKKIQVKINKSTWPYIKTKPLHGSQKTLEENDIYTMIELELVPNYELYSLIFSYGENIEIVSPSEMRQQFKARVHDLNRKYF